MMISHDFDLSNRARREKEFKKGIYTAQKLNERIKHFFKNIDGNCSLSQSRKNEIKRQTLKDIQG